MYDILVIGAGIAGATFASKISKYANTLLLEAKDLKNIPIRTNIFPEHNRPFIEEIDWSDKSIFPCTHQKTYYMGDKENGYIDSKEFGAHLGNISYTENLLEFLLQKFQDNGGILKSNEKAIKINKYNDYIEIINNKGESYSSKLLIIATGSHNNFKLQRSLGFKTPDRYEGIYMHLYGDEDKLNENIDFNYIFHINPNISKNGPFYFNKGIERVSLGFLGNSKETPEEMVSKFNRILNNYEKIQPFIIGLKRDPKPVIVKISKHVIKELSKDRILLLGECAGLVTAFFYEGILCGVASADIAAKKIKHLIEEGSNFSHLELKQYDQEINRILLKNYYKNANASEYLFYQAGSHLKELWDIYANLIKTNKKLRKYIWEAYRTHDLPNYDTSRDRWVGEKIFAKLPPLSKIALGPKFLRAMFK